ncbi:MAG TPA: efflux RND transporter periplasmic adaptor subunit [Acetobacteraceae bacterium]|jgi:membrane fusion protein (multidrug efflux system)|nr:efflux RND transporter periplasmic adaptor subunit [Acetobacteraceae bacterium]
MDPTQLFRRSLATALALCVGAAPVLAQNAPPPAVTVATVQRQDVAPAYTFIGNVQAIQSVQIVARVTAFIDSEPVPQGSDVKAGQVLFELQTSQFQAALTAAQAQLDSGQAALHNAQISYERIARLTQQSVESQANLDQAIATRDQAQAAVLSAQANLAQAALNLSYCTIKSPIEGRIGAFSLTPGNLVTPTTPPLTTVNQVDPIRVVFSVSDKTVVQTEQQTGSSAAQLAKSVTLSLLLANGAKYNQQGKIAFLDNAVDPKTGTVAVYADFPNPDRLLIPGSYITVQVRSAKPEERPLVPVAAVQTDQSGSYVLTVTPDNTIAQQPVQLGNQIAQDYIVTKGLNGGERVVVEGVQKVRPGEKVNPQPAPAQTATGAAG